MKCILNDDEENGLTVCLISEDGSSIVFHPDELDVSEDLVCHFVEMRNVENSLMERKGGNC